MGKSGIVIFGLGFGLKQDDGANIGGVVRFCGILGDIFQIGTNVRADIITSVWLCCFLTITGNLTICSCLSEWALT